MPTVLTKPLLRRFDTPDETRTFEKGRVEIFRLGDVTIGRAIFEPGWRWSKHVKPISGTDSCEVRHLAYVISGHIKTVMEDGTVIEGGPGDLADIPAGHDAWVLGDEPVVMLDLLGLESYARG